MFDSRDGCCEVHLEMASLCRAPLYLAVDLLLDALCADVVLWRPPTKGQSALLSCAGLSLVCLSMSPRVSWWPPCSLVILIVGTWVHVSMVIASELEGRVHFIPFC